MKKNRKNIFKEKLDANFENINDFMKRAQVPVSMETVRRFITERLPINVMSLLVICRYLGFTNAEIMDILRHPEEYVFTKELRYAQEVAYLMGDNTDKDLTEEDRVLIQARRALKIANPRAFNILISNMEYMCDKEGVGVSGFSLLRSPQEV